jgi:outer membrane protein
VAPLANVKGVQVTSINLAQDSPLASSLQWSPAVLAKYYFFSPSHAFRPFVGLGMSYTWFTDVNLNPEFANQLNEKFGNALGVVDGKPGLAYSTAKASSSWVPVYHAGASYMFTHHWGLIASLSYLPLHTKETVTTKAEDGTPLLVNTEYLRLDPLVSALMLEYRF